jgi:hypothetical protein
MPGGPEGGIFSGSLIPGIPGGIVGFSGGDAGGTWGSGSLGEGVSDIAGSLYLA